ncbi:MAG TPA: VCBS repeat-containing protein [Myxococcota bacterium]|nr:VCBS repeat-containing protein [Myxococcota bacterium]
MVLLLLACASAPVCESPYTTGQVDVVESGGISFRRTVLSADLCGPAYAVARDDGWVVASFGSQTGLSIPSGAITGFTPEGEGWKGEEILPTSAGVKWPNEPAVVDVDGDGDQDLLVGTGFLTCQLSPWTADCGGLIWLEAGADWKLHEVVPPGASLFYHRGLMEDLNGDGTKDIVAVGESLATPFGSEDAAVLQAFLREGEEFSPEPQILGQGGGSLPELWDVDADGDQDLISAEYFTGGSFVWFRRDGDTWTRFVVDDSRGPSIQAAIVPNLYGDGLPMLVGSNHVNPLEGDPWKPQILAYAIPSDPTGPWEATVLAEDFHSEPGQGVAAPGVFSAGDLDNDGDTDLLVAGDGDVKLYWLAQLSPGQFEQRVLEESLSTAGGSAIQPREGAPTRFVVPGYDDNVVFLYEQAP